VGMGGALTIEYENQQMEEYQKVRHQRSWYLENLDELKFTSALDLKTFKLCQGTIIIKDCIALLNEDSFFFGCWKNHCLFQRKGH